MRETPTATPPMVTSARPKKPRSLMSRPTAAERTSRERGPCNETPQIVSVWSSMVTFRPSPAASSQPCCGPAAVQK